MKDEKSNEDITSEKDEKETEEEVENEEEENESLEEDNHEEEKTSEVDNDEIPTVEDYNKLQQKNKELFARVKKAEALAKAKKDATLKIKKEVPNLTSDMDDKLDIRFLQRDGLTPEAIEQLRVIKAGQEALGKTISLIEAKNNPLFVAYQEAEELKVKKGKAQLSPSGASVSTEKPLTDEEFEKQRVEKAKAILSTM